MALTLTEHTVVAHTVHDGQSVFEVPAGQWLNIRYGTAESPTDELLVQVPAGKTWEVRVVLFVEETNA